MIKLYDTHNCHAELPYFLFVWTDGSLSLLLVMCKLNDSQNSNVNKDLMLETSYKLFRPKDIKFSHIGSDYKAPYEPQCPPLNPGLEGLQIYIAKTNGDQVRRKLGCACTWKGRSLKFRI